MLKKSLKMRLTLCVVLPVLLALLAVGGVGFYSAYNEVQEVYDTELSHVANLMLSLLKAEDEEEAKHGRKDADEGKTNPDIVELGTDFEGTHKIHERKLAFRIWKDGKLLFYSRKAADFGDERVQAGFSNQEIDEKEWRFYVLPDAKAGYTIEVAQKSKVRIGLITKFLTTVFSPLLFAIPLIMVITWLGLRRGLKPLLAVSEAVKRRSSLDLTPLPPSHALTEITPLINAINSLLANLEYALRKERRFTDFAAHELRTPIAIFKTQAQTALRATDTEQLKVILEAQVQAADRATNLVDQLLTLARLEHTDIPTETLSLVEIAQEIVSERTPLAEQKQIALRFERISSAFVHCNKELLTIALSNLVDNALKYTLPLGEIIVSVATQGKTAQICVSDNGAGIPEDKLSMVTERFYRANQTQQSGAGLGLTIVKRAAEIMGATLILRNKTEGQGLEAILQFSDVIFPS